MGTPSRWTSGSGWHRSALWDAGSTTRPAVHFCLSLGFFLVEVGASRVAGSLLLLSSAFHTLGGALALAVALVDSRLAARGYSGRRNTFGWARARVVGTLAGTVFLSALCLALVPEALRRVAHPRATEHALALMGVGAVGIPLHLARAGLHERDAQDLDARQCCNRRKATQAGGGGQEMEGEAVRWVPLWVRVGLGDSERSKEWSPGENVRCFSILPLPPTGLLGNEPSMNGQPWTVEAGPVASVEKPGQLCRAWFFACLGPLMVLLYSLAFHLLVEQTPCLGHGPCLGHCSQSVCWARGASEPLRSPGPPCWLLYLDPGLAVAVAVVLLWLAWPALRGSALVLLQAVPEELDLRLLQRDLQATEGVAALRELHVWQLDGPSSLVAMVHVGCHPRAKYEAVIHRVRRVFCEHGIHAATVQPDLGPYLGEGCQRKSDAAACRRCPDPHSAEIVEYETTV
uniref:Proton-coupled zinc antiporter SLC30A1-like n=1 Tax=Pogona vitticeps TaxID=103695 RepID=A0ABM5F4W7_9SAUR